MPLATKVRLKAENKMPSAPPPPLKLTLQKRKYRALLRVCVYLFAW